MRKESLRKIFELAKQDKNVVFVGSDLGYGTLDFFKNELPDQFFMEGISEGHIVSMCAGLAMMGKKVFAHTIAPFFVRRALEQIILDVACENLDVTLLCSGGGLVYGPLGHSHTMVEDFSLLWNVPNIKLYAPAESFEMENILEGISKTKGPNYIRMGKGNEPRVENQNFRFNHPSLFMDSWNDSVIVTTGVMLESCLKIGKILNLPVIHFHNIPKKFENYFEKFITIKRMIVVEEHLGHGGLYSRLLHFKNNEKLSDLMVHEINLGEDFIFQYGKQEELLEIKKMDTQALLIRIQAFIEN